MCYEGDSLAGVGVERGSSLHSHLMVTLSLNLTLALYPKPNSNHNHILTLHLMLTLSLTLTLRLTPNPHPSPSSSPSLTPRSDPNPVQSLVGTHCGWFAYLPPCHEAVPPSWLLPTGPGFQPASGLPSVKDNYGNDFIEAIATGRMFTNRNVKKKDWGPGVLQRHQQGKRQVSSWNM